MINANLYIVESPLQLLSAIEARSAFKAEKHFLVVRYYKNKKTNAQLKRLLSLAKWDEVYEYKFYISTEFQALFFIRLIKVLKNNCMEFESIFIGEYRSEYMWMFLNNLLHKARYLLDDGNVTIEVQKNYLTRKKLNIFTSSSVINIMISFFKLNKAKSNSINLFTMFELTPHKNQIVISNNFNDLSSKMVGKSITDESVVYFIGANLVELGIVTEDYFIEAMYKIRAYYKKMGKAMIYIPHRREGRGKLNNVTDLGIFVENFINPVELEFLYKKIRPHHIASFYSTALYSLKKIYNIIHVDSFTLDYDQVDSLLVDEIQSTYKYYGKFINIISTKELTA